MDLRWLRLALTFAVALAFAGSIGGVYSYNRPPMRKDLIVRHLEDLDDSSPQQVFINFMPSHIDVYIYVWQFLFSVYESVAEDHEN